MTKDPSDEPGGSFAFRSAANAPGGLVGARPFWLFRPSGCSGLLVGAAGAVPQMGGRAVDRAAGGSVEVVGEMVRAWRRRCSPG
ncbi:hypothetical protein GCM10012280_25880 [Wenjunlia tyrosinilytica]|uniref:Uncharacterized protein n=1 Tax=Wenjunlia tyrosinilytica TaxID=1544741 RepID=A0A917ZNI1_9ACTN|nr:hypothetical protein GCM10012280_25880 [Wenjunlia tyrosinilytica]